MRPRRDQLVLRAMIPLGALVVVLTAGTGGAAPAKIIDLVLAAMCAACVLRPESPAGLGVLAVLVYVWIVDGPSGPTGWVLLAAAGMVLAHCAAMLAALGPAKMPVDPGQVRLWLRRGAAAWLGALAMLGLVVLIERVPLGPVAFGAGLALLLALVLVAAARLSTSRD